MNAALRSLARHPACQVGAAAGLVLSVAAATAVSQPLNPDLSGLYICEGTAVEGAAYRGFVRITLHDDVYLVRWMFSDGDAYTGIGVVNGKAFAVSYIGSTPGVAAYTIEDATRLVGTWTVAGAHGRAYSETLTKLIGQVHDRPEDHERPRRTSPPTGTTTI